MNSISNQRYYESVEGLTINCSRAEQEVIAHGADLDQFYLDMGEEPLYDAQSVLEWLGY